MDKEREKQGLYETQPELGDIEPSKIRQHLAKGMTAFLVIAASLLFYFALLRFDSIYGVLVQIWYILQPIVFGLAFAYLLNPIVNFMEPRLKKVKFVKKISRVISIFIALLVVLAVIVTLCDMLLPELYKSIRDMVLILPGQMNTLIDEVNQILVKNTTIDQMFKSALTQGSKMVENWLKTDLLRQTNTIMLNLTGGLVSVVNGVMDIFVGFIVSVYVLFSKEKFAKQSKKVVYAVMKPQRANLVLHIAKKANEIFGGFLVGKIIDSLIIGVLCFVGLSILSMPYALLVSVIIGVTNVIPFFGPFIGAVPSTILIMLSDPLKGFYFVIFILVLQQIDGNIIGPKILGESTGLSAFWVVFSILLGGGLFGFVGMIMGVPTFALIYYIVQMVISQKLKRKNLPTDTESYDYESFVDREGKYISSKKGEE